MSGDDLSDLSMLELFRIEAETQTDTLISGLLALEREPDSAERLESLMRAAHSLKGAARMVNLDVAVKVAHVMEDCFVAAQAGKLRLRRAQVDLLLAGVDLLTRIAQTSEAEITKWDGDYRPQIDGFVHSLEQFVQNPSVVVEPLAPVSEPMASVAPTIATPAAQPPAAAGGVAPVAVASTPAETARRDSADRILRVTADNLNRLLGLASESLVESRWLAPFGQSLLRLKRSQYDVSKSLDNVRELADDHNLPESFRKALAEAQNRVIECQKFLSDRITELETYDRRSANLAHRLYGEALACRMRPFMDGASGFPRMVRDVARTLGKEVRLDIVGENTQVDRDILEKLEAPLTHLLRNAVDHGIELPEQRLAAGKPAEGRLTIEARHSAGMLWIIVSDDGRGLDLENLRRVVVERNLTTQEMAARMSEAELTDFLFLPGFSLKKEVTEISGRGVGLDIVRNMLKEVRGSIRVSTQLGKGMRFQLQLPLTLSVVRALIVELAGEPYAFPLAYLVRTLVLQPDQVQSLEGRHHFQHLGRQIGLVAGAQVLGVDAVPPSAAGWPVIILGDQEEHYGVVVERFLGERELVVQPLDPRFGKVKDISAGALMEDGSPVLIVDVEDFVRSVEKLIATGSLSKVAAAGTANDAKARKRVLVVDDSLTVRELERKLLANRGYEVEIAVDGLDGWNAVRTGKFDLIISDVDMPRMDGIELVSLIKKDNALKTLPVMIVSYKDREEDRRRGLEAGADYYLTKGSFHDETLLQAVVDLIGEAHA